MHTREKHHWWHWPLRRCWAKGKRIQTLASWWKCEVCPLSPSFFIVLCLNLFTQFSCLWICWSMLIFFIFFSICCLQKKCKRTVVGTVQSLVGIVLTRPKALLSFGAALHGGRLVDDGPLLRWSQEVVPFINAADGLWLLGHFQVLGGKLQFGWRLVQLARMLHYWPSLPEEPMRMVSWQTGEGLSLSGNPADWESCLSWRRIIHVRNIVM